MNERTRLGVAHTSYFNKRAKWPPNYRWHRPARVRMLLFMATIMCVVLADLNTLQAIEHVFDGDDTGKIKNQVVSAMLDDSFTLTEDTQYKLVFAKRINLETTQINGHDIALPGVLQVSFTVVPQSRKTRVSVFCVVTAEQSYAAYTAQRQQPKYDSWLKDFFARLTAKIEGAASSH